MGLDHSYLRFRHLLIGRLVHSGEEKEVAFCHRKFQFQESVGVHVHSVGPLGLVSSGDFQFHFLPSNSAVYGRSTDAVGTPSVYCGQDSDRPPA